MLHMGISIPGIDIALASTFCGGLADTLTKSTIKDGRYKAIFYNYVIVVALLVIGALALSPGTPFVFPMELLPAYVAQSVVGALAVIAFFKAYESGKASVLAPLTMLYVLAVLAIGFAVFGESLSVQQLAGAGLVLLSAIVLAFEDIRNFKLEKGVFFLVLTVVGWGYYYSFIKLFIPPMGAYNATVALEAGVGFFVALYYIARRRDLSLPKRPQAVAITIRSILAFAGTILYTFAVASIGVSLTSVIVAGTPLVSVPSAHILLGERMSPYKYISVLLIVLGLVVILA